MNPYNNLSDEKLMELYKENTYLAYEILYNRHQSKVYTFLKKRLKNSEQINDIFQNIFLKLHKCRHLYQNKYSFLQWIYTIAKSELIDFYRKNSKVINTEFDENIHGKIQESPVADSFDLESQTILSQREKEALNLRYYKENDFDEISEILKVSPSNSRKIISRALKKLRINLKGATSVK